MDVESCDIAAGSAKRRTPDDEGSGWDCCSLPPLKRFMAAISVPAENTGPLDSLSQENADDSFSYISDLLCHRDFYIPEKCHFSNTDFNDESITTPVSPQSDLNKFLSLLTESEAQKMFSAAENESEVVVPETIKSTSAANTLNGEGSTGLYSGPTLTDVQSALSIFNKAEDEYASPSYSSPATTKFPSPATVFDSFDSANLPLARSHFGLQNMNQYDTFSQGSYRSFSSSINELFYRRLHRAKTEAKYSLKVKCPGNGIDDGYKWRKYGQKAIKNSPYPRSYYRCTNPRCSAKKQVERCVEDPNTLAITYEGLHLHYSYSQLQISQQPSYSVRHQVNNIYEKEAALHGYNGTRCFDKGGGADVMAIPPSQSPRLVGGGDSGDGINVGVVEGDCGGGRRDGLLQDIVPFGIINPLSSSSTCSSASSSSP